MNTDARVKETSKNATCSVETIRVIRHTKIGPMSTIGTKCNNDWQTQFHTKIFIQTIETKKNIRRGKELRRSREEKK